MNVFPDGAVIVFGITLQFLAIKPIVLILKEESVGVLAVILFVMKRGVFALRARHYVMAVAQNMPMLVALRAAGRHQFVRIFQAVVSPLKELPESVPTGVAWRIAPGVIVQEIHVLRDLFAIQERGFATQSLRQGKGRAALGATPGWGVIYGVLLIVPAPNAGVPEQEHKIAAMMLTVEEVLLALFPKPDTGNATEGGVRPSVLCQVAIPEPQPAVPVLAGSKNATTPVQTGWKTAQAAQFPNLPNHLILQFPLPMEEHLVQEISR
jgi:hypothetical protein